jgi:hypothetical protein
MRRVYAMPCIQCSQASSPNLSMQCILEASLRIRSLAFLLELPSQELPV